MVKIIATTPPQHFHNSDLIGLNLDSQLVKIGLITFFLTNYLLESCTAGLPGDRGTPKNVFFNLFELFFYFLRFTNQPLNVMMGRRSGF